MKGVFAFDIDRTLTDRSHMIPNEVILRLIDLYGKGWIVALITGRTFSFANIALKDLAIPFYLGLQQGSDIVHMPSKEHLYRAHLDRCILELMDVCMQTYPKHPLLLYSGFEKGDFCYFHPKSIAEKHRPIIEIIRSRSPAAWVELFHWSEVTQDSFPMLKSFGTLEEMENVKEIFSGKPGIVCELILDDPERGLYVLLITSKKASKGNALRFICEHSNNKGIVVAAGDEENDRSMLEYADYRIVMKTAPQKLQEIASYLAAPACELGIIEAIDHHEKQEKSC